MRIFWRWMPLVLFGLLVGLVARQLTHPMTHDIPSHWVGHPMPQFDLPPAASSRPALSFANLSDGKPKLVNIFASWCIPCATEAPVLAEIAKQGVEVDGIALRDKREDLDGFLAQNGNAYARIGGDVTSSVAIALGSTGVPESYVVDGKGIIRRQYIGELTEADISGVLAEMRAAR